MWISPRFKLYLIKEFERLKEEEYKQLGWDIRRNLTKINYKIHTKSIKDNLIPPVISASANSRVYASEADVLNVALLGMTASEWKKQNPNMKGNIRDYADASQLVCLSNLESINAMMINDGISQEMRINKLNEIAIYQMNILLSDSRVSNLDKSISLKESK